MKNKTIFMFDLDGTLLSEKDYLPPQKTLNFISSLYDKGYILAINTGRPYEVIKNSFSPKIFSKFTIISGYNGSYYSIGDKVTKNALLPSYVKEFINSHKDITTTISIADKLYTNDIIKSKPIIKRLSPIIKNLTSLNAENQDVYSIRLIAPNEDNAKIIFKKLNKQYGKKYDITISTGIYILITQKNINKSNIVNHLIKNNKIIYFGDSQNDNVVFKMNNIFKVAPQNAHGDIKKLASIVLETTSDDSIEFDLNIIKKWTH